MTVLGPISPEELGITLAHEHLFIDITCYTQEWGEASLKGRINEPVSLKNLWWVRQYINNYDNSRLLDVKESTEEVMEFKRYGGNSIVDVTNIGIGRDPMALKNVSLETGINFIMGSGYYVSFSHPPDMSKKTEEEISKEIIGDVTFGVGDTGIRAGIIGEIGIYDTEDPNEEKVLRAAVAAQKETGAPLTIHPPWSRQCERIIEVLEEEGADMGRVIMCHVDKYVDTSMEYISMIADTGLYVEFDTWGFEGNYPLFGLFDPSDTQRLTGVEKMIENGYIDQVLLSQDVCLKMMTMAYGGFGRAHILRDILPLFRHAGIPEEEITAMLIENPRRILKFI